MNNVTVPPRIGLITLACRDCARMARIFRELGWPEAPSSDEHHTVFQTTNGAPVALYPAKKYERGFGSIPAGFRGFTLCINLGSADEVRAAHATFGGIEGVELLDEPTEQFWGCGFSWRDPEGNLWDVAWAEGSTFDEHGGLIFP